MCNENEMRIEMKSKVFVDSIVFSHAGKANILGKARTIFTCHSVINVRKPHIRVEVLRRYFDIEGVLKESRYQVLLPNCTMCTPNLQVQSIHNRLRLKTTPNVMYEYPKTSTVRLIEISKCEYFEILRRQQHWVLANSGQLLGIHNLEPIALDSESLPDCKNLLGQRTILI